MSRWLLLAVAMLLVISGSLQAQHPNHPLGSSPERLYQGALDHIDRVDLMTGTLAIGIPMGPFNLSYNSNVWRYELGIVGSQVVTTARPDREMTAGLGWHLGMGEVYSPAHWYNTTGHWLYVDPDGGRHIFFEDMHMYDLEQDNTTLYTRDGRYLRLRFNNNFWVEVEFPNGITQRFNSGTGGLATTYRLEASWGPYATFANPDLSVTYTESGTTETRTVIDRYGRTHYIHFETDQPWLNRRVTQVDVESFAGQRAIYDFSYDIINVDVSCKHNNPKASARIAIPHLTRIDLPDGTAYSMKEGSKLLYHNACNGGIEDIPGLLTGLVLPTGGKLAWAHQEYEYPPGETNSPFNTSAGVATRRMIDADGSTLGTWTYRTSQQGFVGGNDPEVRTEVVAPTGHCTRYYFNARYAVSPSTGRGWEYGLPFSTTESSGGMLLSDQTWSSNSGGCAGVKLRSSYVRFRHDHLPGTSNYPTFFWQNSNRQLEASRVVYHDDGNRFTEMEKTEFDGLGHFRRTVRRSNFWSGSSTLEARTVDVDYDRTPGVYPGSFVPPAEHEPWVLGTYASAELSEPDAHGNKTSRMEYEFDPQTGEVSCLRQLRSGTARSGQDIVTRHTRNALGQIVATKRWGADADTVSTTGANCGTTVGAPSEDVRYAYQYGIRTKVTPYLASGQPAAFHSLDVDVDPSTGLRIRSRDANGRLTNFDYDIVGRVTEIAPQAAKRTRYSYQPPTASILAPRIVATRHPASGTHILEEAIKEHDAFGRLVKERERLPSGVWSERVTERNARGWVSAVSQWGNVNKKAQFLAFDPFGRPGIMRPSSGASEDLVISRQGARLTTVTKKIAMAGGIATASQTSEVDGHGRLRKVLEPSGPGGTLVPTTVLYDVNNQTTRMASGPSPQQIRAYTYDNLGFRRSEQHPEKGANGNGTVTFGGFDSQGNPSSEQDGPNHLSYVYDDLGRVIEIRDLNQGSRLVSEFGYDTAIGSGKGRMAYAIQHNWVDLPWNGAGVEDVVVEERYRYQGTLGKRSKVETHYRWGGRSFRFDQDFVYNPNADLVSYKQPYCNTGVCAGTAAASSATLTYGYSQGKLTSVGGWIQNIVYATSGAWQQIDHANGAVDTRTFSIGVTKRPVRLQSVAADGSTLYDSGTIAYDGAGNIKQMGQDTFTYDAAGRLVDSTVYPTAGYGDAWRQQYAYDAFGNQVAQTTTVPGQTPQTINRATNAATNRLVAGSYDGAGNLLSWAGATYQFDTQNRLTRAAWMNYLYNARGERVAAFAAVPTEQMRFLVRNPQDQLTSEVTWSPTNGFSRYEDHVWAGDRLVGRTRANGSVTEHYHLDHLGSIRAVSTGTGLVDGALDFLAFGEEVPFVSTEDTFHFAGHERVASSGLDLMHQRAYRAPLSRFLSVDPVPGTPSQPQSLNRYSYAHNNPLLIVDVDGREEEPYWGQGDPIPSPSDWNLQVLKAVGANADEVEMMQNLTIIASSFPIFGMAGVPAKAVLGHGLAHGGGHAVVTGVMTDGNVDQMASSFFKGFTLGVVLTPIGSAGTIGHIVEFSIFGVSVAVEAQSIIRADDGGTVAVLENGETLFFDSDGNLIASGEVITVEGQAPADGEQGEGDTAPNPQDDEDRYPLTQERADWSLNELRRGRCIVDPLSCAGTGGGGFGGLGRRIQWY